MDLIDVAYTAKERKEEKAEMNVSSKAPEYPWGLSLTLNEETLAKLGMEKLPRVGEELYVWAVAKVTSVAMRSDQHDDEDRSVSLQITHMQCSEEEPGKADKGSKAMVESTAKPAKRTLASYYSDGKKD